MEINEIFSKNLARIRKLRGFSQRELASKTKLTQRIINYYENSHKSIPAEKIKILAKALNVRISDFFNEEESSPLDDLDIRWIKKINEIKNLPESDRKEINRHINTIIEKRKYQKQIVEEEK